MLSLCSVCVDERQTALGGAFFARGTGMADVAPTAAPTRATVSSTNGAAIDKAPTLGCGALSRIERLACRSHASQHRKHSPVDSAVHSVMR